MAQILIHDLFEELSQENQRLLHRLKSFEEMHELFENYRQLMIALNANCICDQSIGHKKTFNSLETKYTAIDNRLKTLKTSRTATNTEHMTTKTSNIGTHYPKHIHIRRVVRRIEFKKSETKPQEMAKRVHKVVETETEDQFVDTSRDNRVNCESIGVEPNETISGAKGKRFRPKVFCCEYSGCGKGFREKGELVAHIRLKHTNERPFACDECTRRSPSSGTSKSTNGSTKRKRH